MDVIELIAESPALLLMLALLFGASIGSFINVVIYRLPLMMFKEWSAQCRELQNDDTLKTLPEHNLSLATPASHCTDCGHKISPMYNIPLLSFILLGRKCAYCGSAISSRYFITELVCGALAVFLLFQYGVTTSTLFLMLFTFLLVPLIFIDIEHKLLPDSITYLLLWSGVLYSLWGYGISLENSISGVLVGYLSLWSVYIAFKLITGKEGMGHGDFKLLAAIGAWVGWQQLLAVILISSLTGTIFGVFMMIMAKKQGKSMTTIPFGPYLAMGGWITLIWGQELTGWYLSSF